MLPNFWVILLYYYEVGLSEKRRFCECCSGFFVFATPGFYHYGWWQSPKKRGYHDGGAALLEHI